MEPTDLGARVYKLLAEASPRPWYVVGPPWNDGAPWINGGSEDPHARNFVCDFVDFAADVPTESAPSESDAELVCLLVNRAEAFLDLEKAAREVARLHGTAYLGQAGAAIGALQDALGRLDRG